MTGSKCDNLWHLHLTPQIGNRSAHFTATTSDETRRQTKATILLQKWHDRLGHVSFDTVRRMATQNVVTGLKLPTSAVSPVCRGCACGKSHRIPFPKRQGNRLRAKCPGEFFHSDVSGPMHVDSISGYRFFVTYIFNLSYNVIPFLLGNILREGQIISQVVLNLLFLLAFEFHLACRNLCDETSRVCSSISLYLLPDSSSI